MKIPFFLLLLLLFLLLKLNGGAQGTAPNDANAVSLSGNATGFAKSIGTDINTYTGIPAVGVPIYAYNGPGGLSVNVSLDYFAGGTRLNETPTTVGLGWNLSAGGCITRMVRGMPDDYPVKGFLYTGILPPDYRPSGYQYYHDSLDAEQDVFQFSMNGRSGKFFIGKNNQAITVPLTKLRISYTTSGGTITSFTIRDENGVRHVFDVRETTTNQSTNNVFKCGYDNFNYTSAWFVSRSIAPFGTDTIKYNYQSVPENNTIAYPQTIYVPAAGVNILSKPTGTQNVTIKKLSSIILPDKKTVSFVYSSAYKYDGTDFALDRIKISDSVFRYGYLLKRDGVDGLILSNGYAFLTSIHYYTSSLATKRLYSFDYNTLPYMPLRYSGDTLSNKRDHWGYYNGVSNGLNSIPSVTGIYTGANRNPSASLATAFSIYSITDALGGVTLYRYELNDIYPYNISPQTVAFSNVVNTSQSSITLNQVLNNRYNFNFSFDKSFNRTGNPLFTGTGNLLCSITSNDGLTTYATTTVSLFQMFYTGSVQFSFNLANGNYLLKTTLSGTSSSVALPVTVTWQNQSPTGGNSVLSGGLRIKQIIRMDGQKTDTVSTYNYVMPDGKSSGFLGTIPVYHYPYQQSVMKSSGTTVTNYTAISNDPINNVDYTQGSIVGYSRVEVITGTPYRNLGKTVYEFTDLKDANVNVSSATFPFTPAVTKSWALGLPKKTTVFDSLGRKISSITNTFNYTTYSLNNSNFQSLKLGKVSTTIDSLASPVKLYEYYTGQLYYPESGRADVVTITDTFYHGNNSISVRRRDMVYDTNYNVIQVTSPYDKTQGRILEKRIYYPYHYNFGSSYYPTIGKLRDSSIFIPVSTEMWVRGGQYNMSLYMLSADINDFQQSPRGHILPLATYSIKGNSPVQQTSIDTFDNSELIRDVNSLQKTNSITSIDSSGNVLEVKNELTGVFSSKIFDHYNTIAIAEVANARYADIAYTSFESNGKGNWTIPDTSRVTTTSLTGAKSYSLLKGSLTKNGLNSTQTYFITYWKNGIGTATVSNAQNVIVAGSQNGWDLYTQTISGQTSVTISGTGTVDEIRLYPRDANMATKCYNSLGLPVTSCDDNNTVAYYEYDPLNRMRVVRNKDRNIVKKYEYSDTIVYINTTPNWRFVSDGCQQPLNGYRNTIYKDYNPNSETYQATQTITTAACASCVPDCGSPDKKFLNCICETGTQIVTSCTYTHETGTWQWKWYYHYQWSDGSVSPTYTSYNADSCN